MTLGRNRHFAAALARWATALICMSLLVACSGGGVSSGFGEHHDKWARQLPAEWRGRLHCADCAGVDYRLLLRPDGTFFQRQAFPSGASSDDLGRWYVSSDGAVLLLAGNRDEPDRFHIDNPAQLTKLSRTGRPLRGRHNYTLRRQSASGTALAPAATVQGRYVFAAGKATFEECRSGLVMAVTGGAGAAALEQAYLRDRSGMRAPLLVTIHGRVEAHPGGARLDVARFQSTWPGLDCPPRAEPVPLTGTRWQLVSLNGQPVVNAPGEDGLFIQLLGGGSVRGSAGCEEFDARWSQRGEQISFDDVSTPRKSCPGDAVLLMMFSESLTTAHRWRQLADTLELYGPAGTLLASFKALP